MKRCDLCKKWFKTSQALASHRLTHIRLTIDEAERIRDKQRLKDGRILELEASVSTKSKAIVQLEQRIEVSKCPRCGRLGWDELPTQECPKKSFDKGKLEKPLWISHGEEMIHFKRCPSCGYFEKI